MRMVEITKKCGTCFFGKYRADKNVWYCIKHNESNFSTHVCPLWKSHKEAYQGKVVKS